MFVFDSIVVVRNPGCTLSPANLPPRSSANAANAPPCVAAVVETTVIDIEFADQLILVGLGNSDAEVFRHAGTGRSRGHQRSLVQAQEFEAAQSGLNELQKRSANVPRDRIVIDKGCHSFRFLGAAGRAVTNVQPFHSTFHAYMHFRLKDVRIIQRADHKSS